MVTTLAGLVGFPGGGDGAATIARFNNPTGVATDGVGNVYVADNFNHTIRKVTPAGTVTTVAGLPGVNGAADGIGSAARFNFPFGVAIDSAGSVYVADEANHKIRKITSGGAVTTLAGSDSGSVNGTGGAAKFNFPLGVAVDSAGSVYVADASNYHDPEGHARWGGDDRGGLAGRQRERGWSGAAPRASPPRGSGNR